MTPKTATALVKTQNAEIATADRLALAGQVANHVAAAGVFKDYRDRKAHNTIARQDDDLRRFADYLHDAGIKASDLANAAVAWRGVTWGLVAGFVRWQLQQGFSIGSVNVRLSTVKTYAKLAAKAGTLSATEYALIRTVEGYRYAEGKNIDKTRDVTRQGRKKAEPTIITPEQAAQLKTQPDTPQGRRDRVLMTLLLNLGLRVGEVVGLHVKDVDVKTGYIAFFREKVGKVQTHQLINGTWSALKAYFDEGDAPPDPDAPLLRASSKHGSLTTEGMTRFGIAKRIAQLGERIGIDHLSPHDCRHFWATMAARNKTPIDRLQDAGGWNSPAMPLRYIEAEKIANEGVKLE